MPIEVQRAHHARAVGAASASVVGLVAALLLGLAPRAGAQTTATPDGLRVDRVSSVDDGALVDVTVPRADSGRTLAVDAFEVQLGDEPASITVDRLIDQPVVLDLVLQAPATPEAVADVQGAVAEFVAQIDPATRIRLAIGDSSTDYGQDRAALLQGLRSLSTTTATSSGAFASLLSAVFADDLEGTAAPDGAVRVAVVYGTTDARTVLASTDPASDLVKGGEFATAVTGRFRTIIERQPPTDGSTVLATFDGIAWALRSSYRVTVPGAQPGQRLTVQVTGAQGPARVTAEVPGAASTTSSVVPTTVAQAQEPTPVQAQAPAAQNRADEVAQPEVEGGRSILPVLVAAAVLLVVLVVVLLTILRRRRSEALKTTVAPAPAPVPASSAQAAPASPASAPIAAPVPPAAPAPVAEPVLEPVEQPWVAQPPPYQPDLFEVAAERSEAPTAESEWFEPEPLDETTAVPDLFSNEPEPPLVVTPVFEHAEDLPPASAPPVFSSSVNLQSDTRVLRAAASAERAVLLLRTFRSERPEPMPRALAVAIEAAASGWLENHSVTPEEVVYLLEDGRPNAQPVSRSYAEGLVDLLEGPPRSVWDLALDFAEHLGHRVQRPAGGIDSPDTLGTLLEQATAVVALDDSDFVGRLGGIVGRGLLASWPARAGLMDSVPLIVSPSLAAAASSGSVTGLDSADLVIALLVAMEDAALRMLRAEQAIADLQQRYVSQLSRDPSGSKLASKEPARRPRPDAQERGAQLVALLMGHPLITPDDIAGRLGIDVGEAMALVMSMAERGWLRHLDPPDVGAHHQRWLAQQVLDVATRPLAPHHSPRDPNPIDLTTVKTRSAHHANT